MESMDMGTPWLMPPIVLHSSREYECSFNSTELCEYKEGYWRFWYEADHRYALPTVAFFMTTIILFSVPYLFSRTCATPYPGSRLGKKAQAIVRYLSYRSLRIDRLDWNSAPFGALALAAVGVIFFFCMTLGPKPYYWPKTNHFGDSPPLATRAGWMSLACMPFVFATSPKSNLITFATGVSHERLQVFHRWISYAMYVLALIHTFPFIVFNIWAGMMVEQWQTSVFYWTGVVALLAQTWLTFASMSPLRKLCYEWFKFSHFVAALVFVLFFFFHCGGTLTSWDYFIATGAIYSVCWLHRQLRIYFEYGIGTKAKISLVENGFIRVSVSTRATWTVGQHFFVRFLGLGIHACTNHPFTACSLPQRAHLYDAKESELVFFIRPQGGFTSRLARYAESHPERGMRIMLDGPFGGVDMRKLADPQRLLVFAGGSGAGWVLPLVESFLRRLDLDDMKENPDRKPSMRVVLATRDQATKRWFAEAISEVLSASQTGRALSSLTVEVYYTGNQKILGTKQPQLKDADKSEKATGMKTQPERAFEFESDLESDEMLSGSFTTDDIDSRPDASAIIQHEVGRGFGSMSVFVCGPLSMQHDVANAVASVQLKALKDVHLNVSLHMEHFSWA